MSPALGVILPPYAAVQEECMTVNSWIPNDAKAAVAIDPQWLQRCIALSRDNLLEALPEQLSEEEKRDKAVYMRLPAPQWQQALEDLSSEELRLLLLFFTRAEMLLSGWDAGKDSPAIAINKVLRQRGEKLSKATLQWIRQHSDNRFIPNGGL